jgi:hypothetical protein
MYGNLASGLNPVTHSAETRIPVPVPHSIVTFYKANFDSGEGSPVLTTSLNGGFVEDDFVFLFSFTLTTSDATSLGTTIVTTQYRDGLPS